MKVGLFLTNQQFLDTDMIAALDDQIAMVHHARDFGWDTLLSGQHYLNEGNNQQLQLVPFLARLIPEAGDMNIALGILLLNRIILFTRQRRSLALILYHAEN